MTTSELPLFTSYTKRWYKHQSTLFILKIIQISHKNRERERETEGEGVEKREDVGVGGGSQGTSNRMTNSMGK